MKKIYKLYNKLFLVQKMPKHHFFAVVKSKIDLNFPFDLNDLEQSISYVTEDIKSKFHLKYPNLAIQKGN